MQQVVTNGLPMQETEETRVPSWVGQIPWSSAWQPTPVSLPGESHGQRSLVGYSPRGRKESDTTEHTHTVLQVEGIIKMFWILSFFLISFCLFKHWRGQRLCFLYCHLYSRDACILCTVIIWTHTVCKARCKMIKETSSLEENYSEILVESGLRIPASLWENVQEIREWSKLCPLPRLSSLFSLLHIPSVFHDRVASVVPGSLSLMAVRLSFFLSLKLGATVLGASRHDLGLWCRWERARWQAQHVFPGAGGGWLTLEEACGNSVSLRRRMYREPLGGSPGQLSAISGLRFAVPSVRLDVMWLSQVLQSCELRNVQTEPAFLLWASWCLWHARVWMRMNPQV